MTTQRDRVAEGTTDIGTGPLGLSGPLVGYRTFATAFGAGGNTEVYYGIIQDLSGEWETGLGTYLGPSDVLRRDLVLASSNGGAPVNFPLGDKAIYVTFPADTTLTLRSRRAGDTTLTLRGAGGQTVTPYLSIFGSDGNEGFKVWGTSAGTLTLNSGSPNIRFEENDQTAPAGRWRLMAYDGTLMFQRMTAAPDTFETNMSITAAGYFDFTLPDISFMLAQATVGGAIPGTAAFLVPGVMITKIGLASGGPAFPYLRMRFSGPASGTIGGLLLTAGDSAWMYLNPYTHTISVDATSALLNIGNPMSVLSSLTIRGNAISTLYLDGMAASDLFDITPINPLTPTDMTIRIGRASPVGNLTVRLFNPGTTTPRVTLESAGAGRLITGVAELNGVGTQIRLKPSTGTTGYAGLIYTDASNIHLMVTNNNDADGTYNAFRPLYITKSTGAVTIGEGLTVSEYLTTTGLTKLATTSLIVEIGATTGSQINFMRTSSLSYLVPRDATTLRVQNATGTAWASVSSATGWTAGSDRRLKKGVVPLDYGLAEIMRLRPKRFRWRADDRMDIGLIGQQVLRVIPEAVVVYQNDPDLPDQIRDMLGMHKDSLIPVLIRAMQQQQEMIEGLRERLTALEEAA